MPENACSKVDNKFNSKFKNLKNKIVCFWLDNKKITKCTRIDTFM